MSEQTTIVVDEDEDMCTGKCRAERQVAAVRDEIGRWPAESAAEYDGIMRALEVE